MLYHHWIFFLFPPYPAPENKSRLWIEFCYRQREHDTQTHCAREERREKRKARGEKKKIHKCKCGRVYCATTGPNRRDLHTGIEWAHSWMHSAPGSQLIFHWRDGGKENNVCRRPVRRRGCFRGRRSCLLFSRAEQQRPASATATYVLCASLSPFGSKSREAL